MKLMRFLSVLALSITMVGQSYALTAEEYEEILKESTNEEAIAITEQAINDSELTQSDLNSIVIIAAKTHPEITINIKNIVASALQTNINRPNNLSETADVLDNFISSNGTYSSTVVATSTTAASTPPPSPISQKVMGASSGGLGVVTVRVKPSEVSTKSTKK